MAKLSLLALAALAAACTPMGPGPVVGPESAPMAAATATAAGFPNATYTTTIAASDVPASIPADMRGQMVGAWEIAFGGNGHALVTFNGRQVVDAPYTVSGNQLLLTDDTGDYACHSNARYTWHATATELHLIRVEDSCDGRMVALTAHPLVRR
jgi:hypothetical protein